MRLVREATEQGLDSRSRCLNSLLMMSASRLMMSKAQVEGLRVVLRETKRRVQVNDGIEIKS